MCKCVPRSVRFLSIALAAFAITACDSSPSPVAPSSGSGFLSLPGSFSGATVQGTVNGNGPSALRTAAGHCPGEDDLTVQIFVDGIAGESTLVGCDGRFVFTDVPDGEVTLLFVELGVNLPLGEVHDGEMVEVEISLVDDDVELVNVTVTGDDDSNDDDSAADAESDDVSDDDESDDDESDDESSDDESADNTLADDNSSDDDTSDDESDDDESDDDESEDD